MSSSEQWFPVSLRQSVAAGSRGNARGDRATFCRVRGAADANPVRIAKERALESATGIWAST